MAMRTAAASMENTMKVSQKVKNRIAIYFDNSTTEYLPR